MVVVKAQKIPRTHKKVTTDDILALFCYHFQQYTFADAKKMPKRRIMQMLKVAEKEYSKKMFDFLQIIASQHTKKMSGIKELSEQYRRIIDG